MGKLSNIGKTVRDYFRNRKIDKAYDKGSQLASEDKGALPTTGGFVDTPKSDPVYTSYVQRTSGGGSSGGGGSSKPSTSTSSTPTPIGSTSNQADKFNLPPEMQKQEIKGFTSADQVQQENKLSSTTTTTTIDSNKNEPNVASVSAGFTLITDDEMVRKSETMTMGEKFKNLFNIQIYKKGASQLFTEFDVGGSVSTITAPVQDFVPYVTREVKVRDYSQDFGTINTLAPNPVSVKTIKYQPVNVPAVTGITASIASGFTPLGTSFLGLSSTIKGFGNIVEGEKITTKGLGVAQVGLGLYLGKTSFNMQDMAVDRITLEAGQRQEWRVRSQTSGIYAKNEKEGIAFISKTRKTLGGDFYQASTGKYDWIYNPETKVYSIGGKSQTQTMYFSQETGGWRKLIDDNLFQGTTMKVTGAKVYPTDSPETNIIYRPSESSGVSFSRGSGVSTPSTTSDFVTEDFFAGMSKAGKNSLVYVEGGDLSSVGRFGTTRFKVGSRGFITDLNKFAGPQGSTGSNIISMGSGTGGSKITGLSVEQLEKTSSTFAGIPTSKIATIPITSPTTTFIAGGSSILAPPQTTTKTSTLTFQPPKVVDITKTDSVQDISGSLTGLSLIGEKKSSKSRSSGVLAVTNLQTPKLDVLPKKGVASITDTSTTSRQIQKSLSSGVTSSSPVPTSFGSGSGGSLFVPPFKLPRLNLGLFGGTKKIPATRTYKYFPSFKALAFGIRGKGKKPLDTKQFTGLEVRPIFNTQKVKVKAKKRKSKK